MKTNDSSLFKNLFVHITIKPRKLHIVTIDKLEVAANQKHRGRYCSLQHCLSHQVLSLLRSKIQLVFIDQVHLAVQGSDLELFFPRHLQSESYKTAVDVVVHFFLGF